MTYVENPERSFIGCILHGGTETALEAVARVSPEDVTTEPWSTTFHLISRLATDGGEVDIVRLAEAWKKLKGFNLPVDVSSSLDAAEAGANWEYHAAILAERAARLRIRNAAYSLYESTKNERKPVEHLLAELQELLGSRGPLLKTYTGKECYHAFVNDLERREALKGKLSGIATGFYALDTMTDGLQLGEQFVVGARPSIGKTALACNVVLEACVNADTPTLFVSCEMSERAIMRRIAAAWGRMSMKDLKRGVLTVGDAERIIRFAGLWKTKPFHFLDAISSPDCGQVTASIRQMIRRHGIKLVVVDYLQKIRPIEKHEKRTYEVAQVSSALRSIAVDCNVAMFTLAQLNRDSEKDKPRSPRLSDLADSAQIERDADTIALLHRDRKTNEAALIVAKQRDGEVGSVALTFIGGYCKFENRSNYTEP